MENLFVELFDVISWLSDRGIRFETSGANVGKGEIGIQCPFCGDHAYSGNNHCGINIDFNTFNCWICGAGKKKTILSLIMKIDRCDYRTAKQTLSEFSHGKALPSTKRKKRVKINPHISKIHIPANDLSVEWYLKKRGLDTKLIPKYNLTHGGLLGTYAHRIIIPVYVNKQVVTFTSRDMSDKQMPKYKHLPDNESIIPIRSTLYGLDFADTTAIIVEGPVDVWNIGDGCISLQGKKPTPEQIITIMDRFTNIFVMLDPDANQQTKEIAIELETPKHHIETITLTDCDPGDLPRSDVEYIRKQVFGKIY